MSGLRAVGAVIALGAAACGHDRWPVAAVSDGVAIALYMRPSGERYAVVDDRRWVEISGETLVLDRIDPAAALPSLVIEPLAGAAISIGACLRDRIALPAVPATADSDLPAASTDTVAPILRCTVHARPGRYLVRVLYVSSALGYRAQHDVAVTAPGRATITSRFAIATPGWRTHGEVTLFDGAPGSEPAPRELARGPIALDGGIAVLALPPREVTARLRRIYEGAVHNAEDPEPRDPRWGRESHAVVWVWLELALGAARELDRPGAGLAPGPVHVHVELGDPIRDIDVPAAGRRDGAGQLGLPLWIDDQLRGKRDRWTEAPDESMLTERFLVSVANSGDAPREVWVEEQLRPALRRAVSHAWPRAPEVDRHRLRIKLTVAPNAVERAGFAIAYER